MTHSPIPKGHRAVPLGGEAGRFAWPVSILVREGGSPAPELVMLANLPEARAYLGCLVDDRGMVREWLEIWAQNLQDSTSPESNLARQNSSEQADHRWRQHWRMIREVSPATFIMELPEEQCHPLYLDVQSRQVVQPLSPEGHAWALCRDDQKLAEAGLPKYSESTKRHLWAPGKAPGTPRFVAVDQAIEPRDMTAEQRAELGVQPAWLPINPQGGALAVRLHAPLNFDDYVNLLNGATPAEVGEGRRAGEAACLISTLGVQGKGGRLHGWLRGDGDGAELFYLKLRLVLDAGRALLTHLREHQRPLLNFDPNSLGVFPGVSGELPWPWTTRCELGRPGQAVPCAIPGAAQTRFVSTGDSGMPAYCPSGLSKRGNLTVTIRPLRITQDDEQKVSVEGRIWVESPVPVAASDIVRFRLSDGQVPGDFFGAVIVQKTEARQEIEFRTWPRPLRPQEFSRLKQFEAGKLELCWCEFIPALSSPYDFYSLAILGLRALLSHRGNPLSTVADEMERLGRAAGKQLRAGCGFQEAVPVVERLLAEGAGGGCLAAKHLFAEIPGRRADVESVPPRLWAEALTILLRLMPGLGPVSQCPDYGAAPEGGLHVPLEESIASLEELAARARSLIFSDWGANQEIRKVLAALKESF